MAAAAARSVRLLAAASRPCTRRVVYGVRRCSPGGARGFSGGARYLAIKRYTTDHEWITLDETSSIATIGITNYAQKALGDVVYVELPAVDLAVTSGETMGAVESVKSASDIMSPVTGTVVEANSKLAEEPGLINRSAEEEGWVAKVRIEKEEAGMEGLMGEEEYKNFTES